MLNEGVIWAPLPVKFMGNIVFRLWPQGTTTMVYGTSVTVISRTMIYIKNSLPCLLHPAIMSRDWPGGRHMPLSIISLRHSVWIVDVYNNRVNASASTSRRKERARHQENPHRGDVEQTISRAWVEYHYFLTKARIYTMYRDKKSPRMRTRPDNS